MARVKNRVGTEYNDFCMILGKPKIGKGSWVGFFSILDGSGGLTIGRHCSISSGVQIWTHDSIRWAIENLKTDHARYSHVDRAPVTIGDNVYIGANAIILKGVTIGNQCVIAASSVVTSGTVLPARTVIAGVPARKIGYIIFVDGKSRIVLGKRR